MATIESKLNTDMAGVGLQAFTPYKGFQVVATTPYTKADIGGNLMMITADTTITFDDGLAIPFLAGSVIGLVEGETYIFGVGFNSAIA